MKTTFTSAINIKSISVVRLIMSTYPARQVKPDVLLVILLVYVCCELYPRFGRLQLVHLASNISAPELPYTQI